MFFDESHVTQLVHPFHWPLIGKFLQGYNKKASKLGRPSVKNLQKYFQALDLQLYFLVGLFDNRHALIQLSLEANYLRLYSHTIWYIGNISMRVFKWSLDFNIEKESPDAPV